MTVLLIWEEIPENIKFFQLVNPTEEELAVLAKANGHYLNFRNNTAAQEQALNYINAALCEDDNGYLKDDPAYQWIGRWHKAAIKNAKLPQFGPFDKAFYCGFAL